MKSGKINSPRGTKTLVNPPFSLFFPSPLPSVTHPSTISIALSQCLFDEIRVEWLENRCYDVTEIYTAAPTLLFFCWKISRFGQQKKDLQEIEVWFFFFPFWDFFFFLLSLFRCFVLFLSRLEEIEAFRRSPGEFCKIVHYLISPCIFTLNG